MVQVPAATNVTVVPETVQTAEVVEAKLTVRPEDADALIVNGAVPTGKFGTEPNAMAWFNGAETML